MSTLPLFTRCAHCQTVFRITAPQLQARGGQVRCGRCLQVFDGLAGLQAEAPQSAAQSPGSQPDEIRADASPAEVLQADVLQPVAAQGDTVPAAGIAAEVAAEQPPVAVEDTPVSAVEDLQPVVENHDAVASSEPAAEAEKEWIEIQEAPDPAASDAGDAAAEPVATTTEAKPDPLIDEDNPFVPRPPVIEPRRRAWAVASALLLVVIAGQAIYFYRGEVAARHALARDWITAACAVAGCTVEMPQRPKSVLIEGSDLQVIDPARPERIQLTATLRNHAGHAVGFPALDLVLTNANDHTLARRIFVPGEYLPRGVDRGAGLAANAEMTVRLALDAGSLGASGFRLAVLAAAP